ncbi:TPA: hypothetical protein DCZ39_06960 [Patescibacteria group bacterium]|nr:hypothetical protein [Candidatus Gracilibacteria bacterium]
MIQTPVILSVTISDTVTGALLLMTNDPVAIIQLLVSCVACHPAADLVLIKLKRSLLQAHVHSLLFPI